MRIDRDRLERVLSRNPAQLIYKLDPKLEDGLLCVGGQLRNAPIPTETKHPLILPKNHHISILIARHYHVISGYSGLEHASSGKKPKDGRPPSKF